MTFSEEFEWRAGCEEASKVDPKSDTLLDGMIEESLCEMDRRDECLRLAKKMKRPKRDLPVRISIGDRVLIQLHIPGILDPRDGGGG